MTNEAGKVGKELVIKAPVCHLRILDLALEAMGVTDGFQVGK